jgi:hypothetical protein
VFALTATGPCSTGCPPPEPTKHRRLIVADARRGSRTLLLLGLVAQPGRADQDRRVGAGEASDRPFRRAPPSAHTGARRGEWPASSLTPGGRATARAFGNWASQPKQACGRMGALVSGGSLRTKPALPQPSVPASTRCSEASNPDQLGYRGCATTAGIPKQGGKDCRRHSSRPASH